MMLTVAGVGASTAVGDCAAQTAASIRAGLSGYRLHPWLSARRYPDDLRGEEPLKAAPAPCLELTAEGVDRLLPLAIAALGEACRGARLTRSQLGRAALLVALPARDPVSDSWGVEGVAEALCARTGLAFGHREMDRSGHTGGIALLDRVVELFDRGFDRALVLGVDSWVSPDRLRWLDAEGRCKSRRSPDAFVAGEAAAAVALAPATVPARCRLAAWASAVEPQPIASERRSTADGLSAAVSAILGGARPPRWAMIDLNGESYRATEWGEVKLRLTALAELEHEWIAAPSVGDVGAASAPLMIALHEQAQARAYAPAEDAILCCASDGGLRAAVRVVQEAK